MSVARLVGAVVGVVVGFCFVETFCVVVWCAVVDVVDVVAAFVCFGGCGLSSLSLRFITISLSLLKNCDGSGSGGM